ncbi:Nephrin, partial [Ophiophagus hannah]
MGESGSCHHNPRGRILHQLAMTWGHLTHNLHFPTDSSASAAEIPVETDRLVLQRCILGLKVLFAPTYASTYVFKNFLFPPAPDVLSWGGVQWGGRHGGAFGVFVRAGSGVLAPPPCLVAWLRGGW